MTTYKTNYYRDTAEMSLHGTFGCHIDAENLNLVMEAFTYTLTELKEGQVDVGKLHIVGQNTVKYAQQLLRDQEAYLTHTLHDTLSYKIVKTADGTQSLEVFAPAIGETGGPYGVYVEYGYHPYGRGHYIAPRPFLRPALDFALTNTRKNIEDTLEELFKKIANGEYGHELHYSYSDKERSVQRIFGNRALKTDAKTRGTRDGAPYGKPTREGLSQFGSKFRNSPKYGQRKDSFNNWHLGTRDFLQHHDQKSYVTGTRYSHEGQTENVWDPQVSRY